MVDIRDQIGKTKELLAKTSDIVIVVHPKPGADIMGSALALSLGLQTLGKRTTVVCPDQITVDLSGFIGIQRVIRDVSNRNFVIGLDYVEGSIEKVSYAIEGNRFNLVIEPRAGFDPFTEDKVHFSHSGPKGDVIIMLDSVNFGDIGQLYENNKDFFSTKTVISLDNHSNNSYFGNLNIVDDKVATIAELTALTLSGLGVTITPDIATNLLNALYAGTDNFRKQGVMASAFDLASVCMKAGGVRFGTQGPLTSQQTPQQVVQPQRQQPAQQYTPPTMQQSPQAENTHQSKSTGAMSHDAPHQPISAGQPSNQSMHHTQQSVGVQGLQSQPQQQTPPSEWLKPKIFKSTSNV